MCLDALDKMEKSVVFLMSNEKFLRKFSFQCWLLKVGNGSQFSLVVSLWLNFGEPKWGFSRENAMLPDCFIRCSASFLIWAAWAWTQLIVPGLTCQCFLVNQVSKSQDRKSASREKRSVVSFDEVKESRKSRDSESRRWVGIHGCWLTWATRISARCSFGEVAGK